MSMPGSEPAGTTPRWRSISILLAWGVAIAVLALLGKGLEGRLAPMSLAVPGTPSSRAEAMLTARFGNTIPIAVLLRGPPAELDRQGQRLVAALRGDEPGPGALAVGPIDENRVAAPESRGRVRARDLHPAREPRDGGGARHRSRDRPHGEARRCAAT